jgi:serine/threonine-protein kinase HipA
MPGKNLLKFIAGTFGIPAREQSVFVESMGDAIAEIVPRVRERMQELPAFRDVGKRMLLAWEEGLMGLRDHRVYALGDWPAGKVFERLSDPPKLKNPRTAVGRSPLLGRRPKKP